MRINVYHTPKKDNERKIMKRTVFKQLFHPCRKSEGKPVAEGRGAGYLTSHVTLNLFQGLSTVESGICLGIRC